MIVGLCLWLTYAWTIDTRTLRDRNGNLKGTDFLHLYVLGSLAATHRGADLYSMRAQAALAAERVPNAAGVHYLPLYPPQVSIFFASLSHLSYGRALISWWIFTTVVYGLCCFSLWRVCPSLENRGLTVALLAAGFPAFFHLIAWGQTSAIALALFTVSFFLLRARQEFFAGVLLGSLIFKPQLGLAAACVFLLLGRWKILLGGSLAATLQLLAGVAYYGVEPFHQWLRVMLNVRYVMLLLEPRPYQTHSLRTFWTMLVPIPGLASALYVISAAATIGLTVACWRRNSNAPLTVRYSALLFASVLVSPHLTVYDLVILAPAFILLADWLVGQTPDASAGRLGVLLYLCYMLPLIGPVARWTHIQFSVLALAATLYFIWQVSRGRDSNSALHPQSS